MRDNWITIYDNSADGKVIFASDNITEVTGFEPAELVGREAFSLYHPDDNDSIRKVHASNVHNEKMSSMSTYRHKCKNGDYVLVETVVIYCYDILTTCNYVYKKDSIEHKMRASTVDEVYFCLPNGTVKKTGGWRNNKEVKESILPIDVVWENRQIRRPQERRFCLILNRFTDMLSIVYASSLATELVSMDINDIYGKPFYNYVSDCDLNSMQSQMNLAKERDMVVRLRFDWIIDREKGLTEQVEGVTSCTDDGLLMVLRLSPKFIMTL
ncbi:hypothetical protein INT47_008753 [Mucor saturninus]|uniref:PAS domain-containing protein n=1 Tax=Mucor saturninus TaxID=64648 RepID=A0A8H7V681_9FUNG|nr:hypothetical protein INT47_008753 [Mucor saturninus]